MSEACNAECIAYLVCATVKVYRPDPTLRVIDLPSVDPPVTPATPVTNLPADHTDLPLSATSVFGPPPKADSTTFATDPTGIVTSYSKTGVDVAAPPLHDTCTASCFVTCSRVHK
jgi:hypothetical protein